MSGVFASVVLVCLTTAPICDQEHADVYVQIRRGDCDLGDPLIKPYYDEAIHYGNYQIVCESRDVADDWPGRTFKVEPIKPKFNLDAQGNPQ